MLLIVEQLHDALDAAPLDELPAAQVLRADAHALLRELAAVDPEMVAAIRKPAAWAAAALHRAGQRGGTPRPTLAALAALFGASAATVALASRTLDEAVPKRPAKGSPARGGERVRGGPAALYQMKITLRGARPPVWRRIVVPGRYSLERLHEVIQAAMGWEDCHLFSFDGHGASYTDAETIEELGDGEDARRVRVHQAFPGPRAALLYTYDFGDNWEHTVQLERILAPEAGRRGAICLEGSGVCPPEDCGGVWGYQDLLQILADPSHKEHEQYLEWVGLEPGEAWDPSAFDLTRANRAMRRMR